MARKALVVTQSLAYDGDLHDGESNAEKIDANFTELYEHNSGVIAMSSFAYTGQPSDTETLTIGADVYEFCTAAGSVASDTNIGVVIGGTARATYDNLVAAINASDADNAHATLFQTDDTTPAVANGTEDVLAVAVNGGNTATGTIYLYAADATGGDKVEGAGPDIALSDTATNGGPWRKTNLNLTFGAGYDGATKQCHGKHAIVAANLTDTQPVLVPLPFAPQSWNVQVRSADGKLKPNAYAAITVPAAVGTQNFLGVDVKPTLPTVLQRATIDIPLVDNDISIATLFLGVSHDIRAISYACGEDPGSTLVASIDKITASTGAVVAALTSSEDLAGGTQAGQVTALTLDEAGGDIPIDVTALQGLLFTVTAGNGTVAPRSVTFFVDYIETAAATDVIFVDVYGA